MGEEASERRYNEIRVMGTPWSDQVCISDERCVDDFEFFLIESQSFMKEPLDGFLGLGRRQPFIDGKLALMGLQRGPSFV